MTDTSEDPVVCCFCGRALAMLDAVTLTATSASMKPATQVLFAHPAHFAELVHNSIPLHPDLTGA